MTVIMNLTIKSIIVISHHAEFMERPKDTFLFSPLTPKGLDADNAGYLIVNIIIIIIIREMVKKIDFFSSLLLLLRGPTPPPQ